MHFDYNIQFIIMKSVSTIITISISFCICYAQDDDSQDNQREPTPLEKRELKQIEAEQKLRDIIGSLGPNQHYKIPADFKDFGRRFVLQYPYIEKKSSLNVTDESSLDKIVKQYLESKENAEKSITPVKAPPEFVLSVAKKSALLQASKSYLGDPRDELMQKHSLLRTGDYWNDVVREDVDPEFILRTKETPSVDAIKLEFMPGSSLYELVSELKKISPRLLYVINDDEE